MELTNSQKLTLDKLKNFLTSKDNVFLLKGYAGTGKTFITKYLIDYLENIGRNYILMAPTGKAANVIKEKIKKPATTIHSTIYNFNEIKDYHNDKEATYKAYFELRVNEYSSNTIYIVDEASMVGDKVMQDTEFLKFGSGRVLQDLFEFINLDINDHDKKVIFIGDNAQLPPVGMNFSPALDKKYLEDEYGVFVDEVEMVDVVRQNENSGILQNSIQIRTALEKKVFNELDIKLFDDIKEIKSDEFLDTYLKISNNKISKNVMVIAYKNESVRNYNQIIRNHFFKNSEIALNDKLMIVQNSLKGDILLSNGDFCAVKWMGEREKKVIALKNSKPVEFIFRDVELIIRDKGELKTIKTKILENLLYSPNGGLTGEENRALYVDFIQRHPKLKENTPEFQEAIKNDEYFNALRVKFGYAITCHKAQGSEWENVILDCKFRGGLNEEYYRWLYTAITRATKNLYVINAPHIKLFDKLKDSNINIKIVTKTDDVKVENRFNLSGIRLAIYEKIYKILRTEDIEIVNISPNQYKEEYSFKKDNIISLVDIFYKKDNKISKINFRDSNIKELEVLKELENKFIDIKKEEFKFIDSALEEIYKTIKEKLKDIEITNIDHLPYKERYSFKKGDKIAKIDITYNKKYQLTNFNHLSGSDEDLVIEIKGLLL